MNTKRSAFSFVEIIVVIAIVGLLGVIGLKVVNNSEESTESAKAVGDIETLQNSLTLYQTAEKSLPNPKGNVNYFGSGSEYLHVDLGDIDDTSKSFGKYGLVTENLIAKKYLNYLPLDPKTNQYYSYGKTTDNQYFEIAGVLYDNNTPKAKVVGNYPGREGPYNLIREYNGPDFVSDGSPLSLPFNPEERLLVASVESFQGTVSITNTEFNYTKTTSEDILSHVIVEGDTITVETGGVAELYYSDGSRSTLGDTMRQSSLTLANMEFITDDNLLTRIQLALTTGTLWSKATSLNSDGSEFEVYTQDTAASVRGTIFGVKTGSSIDTIITVEKGLVEVKEIPTAAGQGNINTIIEGIKNETIKPTLTPLPATPINASSTTTSYNGSTKAPTILHINDAPEEEINDTDQIEIESIEIDHTSGTPSTEITLSIQEKHKKADIIFIEAQNTSGILSKYFHMLDASLITTEDSREILKLTEGISFRKIPSMSRDTIISKVKKNREIIGADFSSPTTKNFAQIIKDSEKILISLCKKAGNNLQCLGAKEISTKEDTASYKPEKKKINNVLAISATTLNTTAIPIKMPPQPNCTLDGISVEHGNSYNFYNTSSVPYASTCSFQARTCQDGGILSGDNSFQHSTCSPGSALSCTLDGITKADNDPAETFYKHSSLSFSDPTTCSAIAIQRTCNNGTFSGDNSYQYSSCTKTNASNCIVGAITVTHGPSNQTKLYNVSSAPHGSICEAHKIETSCNNGVLSIPITGYTHSACTETNKCSDGTDALAYKVRTDSSTGKKFKKLCKADLTFDSEVFDGCSTGYTHFKINGSDTCEADYPGTTKKLYAYAPYNQAGDLNLYKEEGTGIFTIHTDKVSAGYTNESGGSSVHNTYNFSSYGNELDRHSSFVEFNGEKGIILDNDNDDDFLKYSNLGLNNEFYIEMSVKGEDLKKGNDNKAYILFYSDSSFRIYTKNNQLIILGRDTTNQWKQQVYNISNYTDFIQIILHKKSSGKIILSIENSIIVSVTDYAYSFSGNYLYIGAQKQGSLFQSQFNGIHNYIKIYH